MSEVAMVPDAVFAPLPDGGVVVHTMTKRYYSLNHTGARIWSLLEELGSPSAAAAAIASEFGISLNDASQAVEQLTDGLVAAGLVRRAP
jgi:hypothetical protein